MRILREFLEGPKEGDTEVRQRRERRTKLVKFQIPLWIF